MTKADVLSRLGITQADMARLFDVTPAAVSQWPDDEPLPAARLLKLKYELHPELFKESVPVEEPPPTPRHAPVEMVYATSVCAASEGGKHVICDCISPPQPHCMYCLENLPPDWPHTPEKV